MIKIKTYLFISFWCLFSLPLSAQITFQKTFGDTIDDQGFSMQLTLDGGYIIVGKTNSFGAGNDDVYLIKTDNQGSILWTKTYGGSGADIGKFVNNTSDGGYIIVGETMSFGMGATDIYLIKTNSVGDTSWTRTYGGISDDFSRSVCQTSDKGYIVAGTTTSFGMGNTDVYLIKTDSVGNILWTKTYGGPVYDQGASACQTSDGGYIIVGSTEYGAGGTDVYLVKADSVGNILWAKTFGGISGEEAFSVKETSDNGYIVAGYTWSFGAGNPDFYLIKTNELGDTLWTKTYGGAGFDRAFDVEQTIDGGYIIAGITNSFGMGNDDVYLIRTNSFGDTLWTKTYGDTNSNNAWSVHETADSGFVLAGYTGVFNYRDVYLIKTDADGNIGCNDIGTSTITGSTQTLIGTAGTMNSGGFANGAATVINNVVTMDSIWCANCDISVFVSMNNVSCNGLCDGNATVSVSGGTGSYTYSWNTGPVQTNAMATGLCAGMVSVTVTDSNGCAVSDSVLITEPTELNVSIISADESCSGSCDGDATVTVTGGTPAYTFTWAGGSGLCAGTYNTTITDANGCTSSDSVNITFTDSVPTMPDSIIGPVSPCVGSTQSYYVNDSLFSGSWTWTVPSGWTINFGQGTSVITVTVGSGSGNICVRKCNSCGCSPFQCMAVTPMPIPPAPSPISGPSNPCIGQTVFYSFIDPWTYTRQWIVPSGWTILSGQGTTGISVLVGGTTGNVCVQLCNPCGCSPYQCMAVSVQSIPATPGTISGPANICEGSVQNYSINVVPTATSYTWIVPSGWTISSGGATSITVTTDSSSGDVCVRACNSCGCSSFNCISVTVDPAVTAGYTYNGNQCLTGNSFCFTNTGTFGANYVWDFGDGMGTSVLENPCYTYSSPGCYNVSQTVTQGACSDVVIMTVCVFSEPTSFIIGMDVSCNGYCDGAATINVSGGSSPYMYSWSGGSGLCAGTYYTTITDFNGCTVTDSVIISEPDAIGLTLSSRHACGSSVGEAAVLVSGGTSPYAYLWNDPGSQTAEAATGLIAGVYTVIVTDTYGCSASDSVEVYDSVSVLVSILSYTNVSCNGLCDGTATATPVCGILPYTYQWNDSLNQTNQTATGLCAGNYSVIIIDSAGQVDTASVVITQPSSWTAFLIWNDATCNGLCDADITINVSGGTLPYTYLWNDPDSQTTVTATGLCAGSVTCYVTDGNGCELNTGRVLTEPPPLIVDIADSTNVLCYGDSTGSATVNVTNGNPPYSYLWNDPSAQTDSTATGLPAGTYTVTVTDTNGCSAMDSVVITESPALSLIITSITPSTCGLQNGGACVSVIGGCSPYVIVWDDPFFTVGPCIDSVFQGTYNAVLGDACGCPFTLSVDIGDTVLLVDSISTVDVACFGDSSGTATVFVSGGAAPLTYTWTDSLGDTIAVNISSISNLPEGLFTIVVSGSGGCSVTDTFTINEPDSIIVIYSPDTVICYGDSVELFLSVSGGVNPFTLWPQDWCMFGPPCIASPDTTTTYMITATDANGCTSSDDAMIMVYPPLSVTVLAAGDTICDGDSTSLNATAIGGDPTSSNTYLWLHDGSATSTVNVSPSMSTAYQVVVSDSCSLNDTATVTVAVETCTGIDQSAIANQQSLIVYPNPNTGEFTVEMDLQETTSLSIKLYHFTGQLIQSEAIGNVIGNYIQQMDLSKYSKGVYYVQVMTEKGVVTKRVVYQ